MKTGVNTSTIINFKKKRNAYQRKGGVYCKNCKHFRYGYYCKKTRRSAEHYDKPKQCKFFEVVRN